MSGGGVSLILALSAETSCQQQLNVSDAATEPVDEIIFRAADPSLDAEVSTKATAVTSLTSFNVSAVTGAAGSETAVWTNVAFSGNNTDGYKAAAPGKWWPSTDASYRFYAANSTLTFAASGATVAVTNATDIICAYMASPAYKAKNTLSFEHIFARLGQVTVSAATGYTINNVSIKITPKTGGTYNLRTGAGHTDGTGWSGLTTGSESTIASATGANANDIYLVPGTYTLTASWRAVRGNYTEDIEGMPCDVSLTAGKINNITTTLSGNAQEVAFSVSIAAWTNQNVVVEFPTFIPTFGGLQIAPAPLYYNGTTFEIKDDDWNHDSYNSVYGKNTGSYYFNFVELGSYFDADGGSFSTSSGDIDNTNTISYDGHDDWRLPTQAEWCTLTTGASPGTSRTGSTVNGNAGSKYAIIQLTGVTHAGNSAPYGLLLFPDGATISGKTLSGINNSTATSGVTLAELQTYLDQGCAFLPASGRCSNASWAGAGYNGYWWSSAQSSASLAYLLGFNSSNLGPSNNDSKSTRYFPVRLVRRIPPKNGVYIKYTDGSYSAYNDLEAGKTPVGIALKTDACSLTLHPNEGADKTWSTSNSSLIAGVTTEGSNRDIAKTDYAGKANSAAVSASGLEGLAFTFARNATYADSSQGWLPSCGELEQIKLNATNINTAMTLIGGTNIDFSSKDYWCSTQFDSSMSWFYNHNAGDYEPNNKFAEYSVRSVSDF